MDKAAIEMDLGHFFSNVMEIDNLLDSHNVSSFV